KAEAEKYQRLASEISAARQAASARFAKKVEAELKQVAMERCHFRVGFVKSESEYSQHGLETIQFEIEPNPGEGFRELTQIASGGELSRLMLALKVVTQQRGSGQCLIFDEIDAGIGGRIAHQIGERLKALALQSQVLCVTHLPQVAAF